MDHNCISKCRTNNLQLNDRRRFRGEEITCDVCGAEKEDPIHFLLWCPGYSEERRKSVKLQQPYIQEEEEIVGRYLFENKDIEEGKRDNHFWKIRERMRKEKERETEVIKDRHRPRQRNTSGSANAKAKLPTQQLN